MTRILLAVCLALYSLSTFIARVGATCEACPNCDYERINNTVGDACLNYWTCSGDTITCYYPSVANPGTFTACAYNKAQLVRRCPSFLDTKTYETLQGDWGLVSGPSDICFPYAGLNSKCQPGNDPYNLGVGACTASYGYVGGINSQLL